MLSNPANYRYFLVPVQVQVTAKLSDAEKLVWMALYTQERLNVCEIDEVNPFLSIYQLAKLVQMNEIEVLETIEQLVRIGMLIRYETEKEPFYQTKIPDWLHASELLLNAHKGRSQ